MIRNNFNLMDSDVKSCFVFRFEESRTRFPGLEGKRQRAFRDPAAVPIACEVAQNLADGGYVTSEVKPGKACHAAFECSFERMYVAIVFSIDRNADGIECAVYSNPLRPVLCRRIPFTTPEIEEWRRLGVVIDRIIRAKLKPNSYAWLTFNEFEAKAS